MKQQNELNLKKTTSIEKIPVGMAEEKKDYI